ncbi:MAG: Gfo/Idh/MocA family oxidoreductase [Clostridia bacterium]
MIKYAVIGIGRMGKKHAVNLVKGRVKNAVLTAVCDTDKAKLDAFKAKFPRVRCYTSHKEMLAAEKLDAAIVATPHYFHSQIVIDLLQNSVSALSEKPAAVTVGDAMRAINAKKDGLLYGIMYNQRTNRMYKRAKQIIDSGALGEIKRVNFIVTDWYRSQYYYDMGEWRASWKGEGGGILINQCVHQLDILQWLIGMPQALTAHADTVNRKITVENEATAIMDYPQGFKCVFCASGHELHGTNRLEIAADKGKIVITQLQMKYYKFNKPERRVNQETKRGYGWTWRRLYKYNYGIVNAIRDITIGQQINIIKNFTAALLGKEQLIAEGGEGVKALSLINGIYLSAHKGEKVSFPLDEGEVETMIEQLAREEKNEKNHLS